jgi:hypothetical protein
MWGPNDFLPTYYLTLYPDVQHAYLGSPDGALRHYRKYGIDEGRSPNYFFDPCYYVAIYPDVAKAYGTGPHNMSGALNHFVNYGLNEGRRGSYIFDPRFYLGFYSDLSAAFGPTGYAKAYEHWLEYGIREQRRSIPESSIPIITNEGQLVPGTGTASGYVGMDVGTIGNVLRAIPVVTGVLANTITIVKGMKDWFGKPDQPARPEVANPGRPAEKEPAEGGGAYPGRVVNDDREEQG